MEESNQFLEENAITYDTEADEKVIWKMWFMYIAVMP